MIPFDEAAAVYDREPCARSFESDLISHFRTGYVHSTPAYFIMGRGINSRVDRSLILDPDYCFTRDEQDAWLVWLYAGDIREALKSMPYPLPKVCFERHNDLRFYPLARFADFLASPQQS